MRKAIIAGMVALCGVTLTASATVRKVPSEYPHIQAAIDAAVKGDTVLVSPGVYYETINFNGKDIVVTGTDPNDPRIVGYTIINADGDGTVVTFENQETNAAVLQGFTITGGFGTLMYQSSDGTMKEFWGPGIYCFDASPTITHNVIANNRGVYDVSADYSQYSISYGGGIACEASSAIISHNIFKGNYAYFGGGLLLADPKVRAMDNLIYDNSAYVGGGVAFIAGSLVNNTIVGNEASDQGSDGLGGNLFLEIDPTMEDYSIWNNIICNATAGGGLVWYQEPPDPVSVAYNDIWGNVPGDFGEMDETAGITWSGPGNLIGVGGNISVDPQFANPLNKDFHLTVDSPCVNAGNPDLAIAPRERDKDNAARVYGGRVDMGAYEFVGYIRPAANAGADQHILQPLAPVTLDGKGSFFYDPCGVKTYRWSQVSGPIVVLSDPSGAKVTFTPALEGEYAFQLVVADATHTSPPDQVIVLVSANHVPVANAGPGTAWQTPSVVTLDGTNSYDADKVDHLSYQWRQVEGESVVLRDANTAKPSFTMMDQGVYVFELVVSDGFTQSVPSRVQCVGVRVTGSAKRIPQAQLTLYAFYPDVSGTNVVYSSPGQMSIYDARITCQDLVSGKTQTFGTSGCNLEPKIDGDLVVWFGGVTYQGSVPDCTSVLITNLATGAQRELRTRSNTASYSHPAISGNKVVWVQHLGIDKSTLAKWSNMPYDICGADVSNFDKPVYFTIATKVGKRDPYPYRNLYTDVDHVLDISGNIVVWEGNGDIYAADISDPNHIKIATVCSNPARQYNPSISGRLVVWTDERNDRGDIYGADLSDWQHIREFVVAKAPGMQSQPMIDGCHIAYTSGSAAGGQIMLACVTRQYGILNVTMPGNPYGAVPVLDGMRLVWADYYGEDVLGQTLSFSYQSPDGRVQNVHSASRAGRRYDYIQHAICDANDGDVLVAQPDRYEEKISFAGKGLTVRSTDPNNPAVVAATVLTASGNVVSFIQGEQANSVLRGFTIEGGNQGVFCNTASPTISQCTIRGSAQAGVRLVGGGGLALTGCRILGNGAAGVELSTASTGRVAKEGEATLSHCLIAGNGGPGVHSGKPTLINCTVVENQGVGVSATTPSLTNSIVYFNVPTAKGLQIDSTRAAVTYSDVQGGWAGDGNINADPLFVSLGHRLDSSGGTGVAGWVAGDYHLKSQGWRWNAAGGSWVSDGVTSPCLDAGDPASPLFEEPLTAPNNPTGPVLNSRIDMGAYGGTAEASLAAAKHLKISCGDGGTVPKPGVGDYPYARGTVVSVQAQPATHYSFTGWTGTAVDQGKVKDPKSAATTVTMDDDYTLVAGFQRYEGTLTIGVPSQGAITTPGTGTFTYPLSASLPQVSIKAQPDPDCYFIAWTGTAVDQGKVKNPKASDTTVLVDGDYTLYAKFAHNIKLELYQPGPVTPTGVCITWRVINDGGSPCQCRVTYCGSNGAVVQGTSWQTCPQGQLCQDSVGGLDPGTTYDCIIEVKNATQSVSYSTSCKTL